MTISNPSIKEDLKIAYDTDASRRADQAYRRDGWKIHARQKFINQLTAEGKHSLLELGAGAGLDSKFFIENGLQVLAIDLSEGMVRACIELGVNAQVLDVYGIRQLEQRFDAVYSMNVLLHIPRDDLSEVLSGIHDVLNDGGLFYFGVYGGFDEESTFTDSSKMALPRFFSFLSDASISEVVTEYFDIVHFEIIDIDSQREGLHYQSLILRKRSAVNE